MTILETQDIQGIIVSGYKHLPYSKYLFLQIKDPNEAKSWLKKLIPLITDSDWLHKKPTEAINIAFTYLGLKAFGLPYETLAGFSQEFIEGMADPNRLRQLGDVEASRFDRWDIVWRQRNIHALLVVQAKNKEGLERFCHEEWYQFDQWGMHLAAEETGYQDLQTLYETQKLDDRNHQKQCHGSHGRTSSSGKEHFGFRDGISQPEIEGSPKSTEGKECIKAGEFILGYPNEDGDLPFTPTIPATYDVYDLLQPSVPSPQSSSKCPVRKIISGLNRLFSSVSLTHSSKAQESKDFGRNGSYLVFRKLSQDVIGFHKYFSQYKHPDLMKAKVVGRWSSGAPLSLSPTKDNDALATANDFSYAESDSHGYGCPLGAHIRRANPRDSLSGNPKDAIARANRRRILRRGALYGTPAPANGLEDDGSDRGLLFFCINANIRRQFEFIQQTWINNPKFNGFDNEADPLTSPQITSMTIPKKPVSDKLKDLPSFVTVKGGEYFFLPSLSALRFLAQYQC